MELAKVLVIIISRIFVLLLCGKKVSSFSYDYDYHDYCQGPNRFSWIKENIQGLEEGFEIDISYVPYQVSIMYEGKHTCGGSIINNRFILTAAHCLLRDELLEYEVRVGSSFSTDGGIVHKVAQKFPHPQYNEDPVRYDIGLIALQTTLVYSSSVQPIVLASLDKPEPPNGSIATLSGWGTSNNNHLIDVDLPTISRDECLNIYRYSEVVIYYQTLCAGYAYGDEDACIGNGGSPLVLNGVQIGVNSWRSGCASPKAPGVYTSVSVLRDFITCITKSYDVNDDSFHPYNFV